MLHARACIIISVLSILFFLTVSVPYSFADRLIIPVKPDVSVYEPGQKAIVAWNGTDEALILSTDVNVDVGTSALEIMPLPSNPKAIQEADFESFETVESLIWANIPAGMFRTMGELGGATLAINITFHEKIGAHDITVVNVTNASALSGWAESFLQTNGISENLNMQKFEPLIDDYLNRGFNYFVFDLIEATQQQKSLNPILYRFDTSFLYYPLEISSLNSGSSRIILFLITEDIVDQAFCAPFNIASYKYTNQLRLQSSSQIQFKVATQDLSTISQEIGKMFNGNAWLTALQYEGEMKALTSDFEIHSFMFPISHLLRAAPIAVATGLIGSGVALIAYANFQPVIRKKTLAAKKQIISFKWFLCLLNKISASKGVENHGI